MAAKAGIEMRIEELMTRSVITCRPADTLDTAVRLMLERDCGVLPVIGSDGHLAGIVTDRDICVAAHNEGLPLRGIRVEQAMSTRVIAARPHDSLEMVEQLMSEKQIRRIPVVNEDGHVVGLIALNDIVRAAAHAREQEAQIIATLAAVCQPRRELGRAPAPVATVR
jgi:CBS domain-containing protein